MQQKNAMWWLEDMPPRICGGGDYEATIAATDTPAGTSCCAWEIRKALTTLALLSNAKHSKHDDSDEQRGYVSAALGAISELQGPANLTIYTNNTYVVNGLNGNARKWKCNGWMKSDNKPAKNVELWEVILHLISERSLEVKGIYESKESHIPYDRVHQMAKVVCANR